MAAAAHGYAHGTMVLDSTSDDVSWWMRQRKRRLERRLVPAEARFFDAYCRGGEHQHESLAVDYAFVNRPKVRAILHAAVAGGRLDTAGLEAEYLAAEGKPDVAAFRANVAYLAKLVGR